MKKIIILSTCILSTGLNAETNYKLDIYKDFIIEPISFINSNFYKSINKKIDTNKFFNSFVLNKDLKNQLIKNGSMSDVLNICYNIYLDRNNKNYINNAQEGKYCLYNLALSGNKQAYSYISTYHFDKYKENIIMNSKIDVDSLIKMSVYAGLGESSDINLKDDGVLKNEALSFSNIVQNPIVKVENKNIFNTYFNEGILMSVDLPVSYSLSYYSQYNEDFYSNLMKEYEEILKDDKNIYKDFKRNSYNSLIDKIKETNKEYENIIKEIEEIDKKDYLVIKNICKDVLYGSNKYEIENNIAEYCLSQITLNNLNKDSAYDLGLYFYVLYSSATEKTKNKYLDKSITWLSLGYELNNESSIKLLDIILKNNKENKTKYLNIIQEFNAKRKIAKMLIEEKINK